MIRRVGFAYQKTSTTVNDWWALPYISMRTYSLAIVILFGLLTFAATASAGEPWGRLAPYWRTPTPYYVGNPKVIQPKTDEAARMAGKTRPQSIGPYAYPYGYFGAQTRPYVSKSFGYYENYSQASYGWGY